jgi:hypothetical protein
MSHFPGFKDRAQFDTALDELLNRLTSAVSPDLTYTSAFKPWMEGEVSIAAWAAGLATPEIVYVTGLRGPTSRNGRADASRRSAVRAARRRDRRPQGPRRSAELARFRAEQTAGLTTTSQDYAGTKLYTMGSGSSARQPTRSPTRTCSWAPSTA